MSIVRDLFNHVVRPVLMALILVIVNSAGAETQESVKVREPYSKSTYVYKRVADLEIKADVFRAPGDDIRPAILWIHGGALMMGSRTDLPPPKQLQAYLESGYTLISIDYRLAPESKLPQIVEDLEDAYAWVRAKGPELFSIDKDRVAVMGMSAGGYLTLVSGYRLSPGPQALVSFYGYGDITGPWYSQPDPHYRDSAPIVSKGEAYRAVSGPVIANTDSLSKSDSEGRDDFYMYCRQNGLWPNELSGRDLVKEPEWFAEYEPRKKVTVDYPPTMLLHGESDTDVPYEQSVLMAAELKRQGVEYQFISQPHWQHGFDALNDLEVQEEIVRIMGAEKIEEMGVKLPEPNDPTIKEAHQKVLQFLDGHLK